jgi:SP family arabinose:H+ symporter-like MFS transporter
MKKAALYVLSITLVAAIGGLIFGFDTAIVAGATRYMKEQFSLNSLQEGWAVSVVLIGCMFGAGLAGPISDRIGRRRFMLISAVLFLVSAVGCALPRTITAFVIFRFVGGLGIGSAAVLSPLYIAEVAPARVRGALVSVNQLAIVTGIMLAYFVNWAFAGSGPANWRWMFGMGAIPSVFFFLLLLRVPESPRWLVKNGREDEARTVLTRAESAEAAAAGIRDIKDTLALEEGSFRELFHPAFRRPLVLAIVLAVFQQITGINAILYYAPRIFEGAGFARMSAIGQSAIVGLCNMLFTLVAIVLCDKIGRRPLLLVATGGMGVSLVHGPARLGGHGRGLPHQGPGQRHGPGHPHPLVRRLRRHPDLPGHLGPLSPLGRLLALRGHVRLRPGVHVVLSARDQGPNPGGDRKEVAEGGLKP